MTPSRVADLPEHPTGIEVSFEPRCQECGANANPPIQPVAKYPDPQSDAREMNRCRDCYVDLLMDVTQLDKHPAAVLAMLVLGYSHEQIAFALGTSASEVERQSKEARDAHRLRSQNGELSTVFNYL